jgi:hypothetical protein
VRLALIASRGDGSLAIVDGALLDFDMSEEEYAKALKDGIMVRRPVQLDPGASQVRLVVLDRISGLAGTAKVALPREK